MPVFTSYEPGQPCWVDLMSPDVDASKAFYSAVFGWDAHDELDDEGNRIYVNFSLDGNDVAGLGANQPGMPPMAIWNSYVCAPDVAATVAKVESAGGTVMMPPMQVMSAGHMAIIADPTGAVISIWQPGEHPGAGIANEPNTWSWNELMTRDIDTALPFYTDVFGWQFNAMDMGGGMIYHVVHGGTDGWAGAMAMPPDVPDQAPNHWAVYFMVADTDATVAAVTANGGSVVMPPMDTPGVGRMCIFHDPQGGSFSTLQPEQQG
jgi:hypothetical protein